MTHHYGARRVNPAHIYSGMDTKARPQSTIRSAEVGKMSAECPYCDHIVRAVKAHWSDLDARPPVRQNGFILSKHTDKGTIATRTATPCRGSGTGARRPAIFEEGE